MLAHIVCGGPRLSSNRLALQHGFQYERGKLFAPAGGYTAMVADSARGEVVSIGQPRRLNRLGRGQAWARWHDSRGGTRRATPSLRLHTGSYLWASAPYNRGRLCIARLKDEIKRKIVEKLLTVGPILTW